MKKTEKILGAIIAISIALRLITIPYVGFVMVISLVILAFFYFAFGLIIFNEIKFKDIFKKGTFKDISRLRKIGAIATGFSLSLMCIGILFKLGKYSETNIFLVYGFVLALTIVIISVLKISRDNTNFYKNILLRLSIVGFIGLIILFIPI
uniref:hypothetical protein n=1 Tax=uncultured Draconibacterium sp. TaxID=1573823 RepID=UPI003217393D